MKIQIYKILNAEVSEEVNKKFNALHGTEL